MKLYEDESQMSAWDFIENKKIDIMKENSTSNKEVAYICPKCQKKYNEKINEWANKQCEQCRKNDTSLFDFLSGKWKRKRFLQELPSNILLIVFGFCSSLVSFNPETFDVQFIYMAICYTVFLVGVYMLLQEYFHSKLLKNPLYQRYIITTFSLLKEEDIFALNKQVNLSLAGFIKPYVSDKYTNEDIVYNIKTSDKYFLAFSNNKHEVKYWKKRIQNDTYYNQILSDFETKSMINFNPENKIVNNALEFLITFIGIILSVTSYIENWERFGWKSLTLLIIWVFVFFILVIPRNKFQELNKINEAKTRLIIISSAIAKKYNQSEENQSEVN